MNNSVFWGVKRSIKYKTKQSKKKINMCGKSKYRPPKILKTE